MQKNIIRLFVHTAVVFLFAGCNIYAPFTTKNNQNDYIEEAQKCLKNNDIGCAIDNYSLLPDGELKNQKLCVSYLSRAGFTSKLMLNVVAQNSDKVLGNLANALVPWTAQKMADAVSAAPFCNAVSGNVGTLFKVITLFVDCGLRMAKADVLIGSSPSDTTCTTPNPASDGQVTKADIGSTGAGMCTTDITACAQHFVDLVGVNLSSAGLGNINDAFNQIPAGLRDPTVTAIAGRAAIQSTLAN